MTYRRVMEALSPRRIPMFCAKSRFILAPTLLISSLMMIDAARVTDIVEALPMLISPPPALVQQ